MAAGQVITGFSLPYVALYSVSGTTVSYSSGQKLARGVEATIAPDAAGGDNNFYADNIVAESMAGQFSGGTLTLTVDGLLDAARKLIFGLPTASTLTVGASTTVDVQDFDDRMAVPYVGVAFIIRVMSGGVTSYVPVLLSKCKFEQNETAASTQEEEIDWQTEELSAQILRADDTNHTWKRVAEGQDTEAEAEAVIKAFLGIS